MSTAARKRSKPSEVSPKKAEKAEPRITVRQQLAFLVDHVYFALTCLKFIDHKVPVHKFRSVLDKDTGLIAFFDKCINGDDDDLHRFYRIEWPDKFNITEDDHNPVVLAKLHALRQESAELRRLLTVYGDAKANLRARCNAFSE